MHGIVTRITLQDIVRRLTKNVQEDDEWHMDQLKDSIHAKFAILKAVCLKIPGISGIVHPPADPTSLAFDDLDDLDEPVHDDNVVSEDQDHLIPSHSRQLPCHQLYNFHQNIHIQFELTLRKRQANWHLNLLREAIANKSFQYSHII